MSNIQYGQYTVPSSDILVNFGVGQPSNNELPLEIIKNGCKDIIDSDDKSLLQYGDIPGYFAFRKTLAKFLEKRYEVDVNPNNLFVTNGVTGALSLICSLYIKKCNTIYVEEPTYFLAINIFKEFGFKIETIELQEDGINTDILEEKLNSNRSETKLLYTIPSFHNPTSVTMSDSKRRKLAELSSKHNMHIIADEVYQLLSFKDEDKPPMPLCYYSSNVFSLSSFSKILAPSLRLGWIQSSDKLLNVLKSCGQLDSSGGINPFISRIVHSVIENGELDNYLDYMRGVLYERCMSLCNNLKTGIYNVPKGGYFVWVETGVNTIKMLDYSSKNKVKYHSGNKFSGDGRLENFMRLSFSFYKNSDLALGADRLNNVYKYYSENVNKIFVGINGSTGKLGSKIKSLVNNKSTYVFNNISREIDYEPSIGKDVIIDVSSPEGTKDLLEYLISKNCFVPIIIGTTGKLPTNLIKVYSEYAPIAIISNFSYGIPILEKILKNIDYSDWNVSIEEIHHKEKKDSPSGTAKTLSNIIGEVENIESKREEDVFGVHKVKLENENEIIEFNHTAKNRDIFASGSLRYIDWILEKSPDIYYDLEDKKKYVEKWNCCGNTFLIIDEKYNLNNSNTKQTSIKKMCLETNSDGAIFYKVLNDRNFDFEWKYINRDDSLVEMCGNGARCISKYIQLKLKKNNLCFKNNFGIEQCAIVNNDFIEVMMPKYEDYHEYNSGYFVNVGVPHYVLKVNNIYDYDLKELYKNINNHLANEYIKKVADINNTNKFNINWEKCNVNIYQLKGDVCYTRTFEKGVEKETGACGSGCCAVFYNLKRDKMKFITTSKEIMYVQNIESEIYLSSKVNREFRAYI